MRLLKCTDLSFEVFLTVSERPAYAILSHTWGKDEITFEDAKRGRSYSQNKKEGYSKLEGCCRKAIEDGFEWVSVNPSYSRNIKQRKATIWQY